MTNTGIPAVIFPAENGNRENGRENTPTVPVFLFFSWKRFTVGLDGKRSLSRQDFPVPFSTQRIRDYSSSVHFMDHLCNLIGKNRLDRPVFWNRWTGRFQLNRTIFYMCFIWAPNWTYNMSILIISRSSLRNYFLYVLHISSKLDI